MDSVKTFGSDKLIHAIDIQQTLAGVPQSRDRRSFFMDLTLRRAKGFVQNNCGICRGSECGLPQKFRRGELYEPLTNRMPVKMGARVTRPSESNKLRRAAWTTYRWMRAEPPLANAFTCSTVAIVVSPGNVVSSAPCAQPRLTASCGVSPVSRP